ncbi:MAG: precorrin-6A reductase [Bacillota bacterium]|nr:precorrin-6A reductase [Bacillota bacterium]
MVVWVLAGTKDAVEIINEIAKPDINVLATVTTEYGKELAEVNSKIKVYQGKMDLVAMLDFVSEHKMDLVIDASHPYAKEASINAMKACQMANIKYIRFERRDISVDTRGVIRAKNFEEAAQIASEIKGNILLTIGSNNIHYFTEAIPDFKNRVFARILPTSKMLLKCEEAGLGPGNIIAMKGPFSKQMNIETLKYCKASVIVTKESGETGGTVEKLQAAAQLGIQVILIDRPDLDYTLKFNDIKEVIDFVNCNIG